MTFRLVASVKREVKDSRMYESGPFWDEFGHVKWVSFRFDEIRAEVVRDMSR